jgi:cobalamin biosynthesis protein CbiD
LKQKELLQLETDLETAKKEQQALDDLIKDALEKGWSLMAADVTRYSANRWQELETTRLCKAEIERLTLGEFRGVIDKCQASIDEENGKVVKCRAELMELKKSLGDLHEEKVFAKETEAGVADKTTRDVAGENTVNDADEKKGDAEEEEEGVDIDALIKEIVAAELSDD